MMLVRDGPLIANVARTRLDRARMQRLSCGRCKRQRDVCGATSGRRHRECEAIESATAVTNLLAGLGVCGVCGSGLVAETYRRKGEPRTTHYTCAKRRANGSCSNGTRLPIETVDEAVLHAIEEHALTPAAVESVLLAAEHHNDADIAARLRNDISACDVKITRLVAAIEAGADTTAITGRLRDLEQHKIELTHQLADARPLPRLAPHAVETRLAEWRRLLRADTGNARAVLGRVLAGPIPEWLDEWQRDHPEGDPAIAPDETLDPDFEAVLQRAHRRLGEHRGNIEQNGSPNRGGVPGRI
jgi:recombinase-like zinc beta ribbon protein